MPESRQLCTFYLDRLFCGIDVRHVREVLKHPVMTPVPLVSREVSGLINLRGQIVPAIDLRCCLELPDRPANQQPMNLVAFGSEGAVSLLVDSIHDVLELSEAGFELPPETVPPQVREILEGVYKLDGRLLHVLKAERLLSAAAEATS